MSGNHPLPLPLPLPLPPRTSFNHERLHVYQVALDFIVATNEITQQIPVGRSSLSDQLQRASISVLLNIAEGAGEFSRKDKARFYRMAIRSATECGAVLDICNRLKLADTQAVTQSREMLIHIVSMLVRMCQGLAGMGRGTGMGKGKGTGEG